MLKAIVERNFLNRGTKTLSLLTVVGASLGAPIAHADLVTDVSAPQVAVDSNCIPESVTANNAKGLNSLTCNANEFVVTAASVQAGNFISQCTNDGQQHVIDVLLTLQSSSSDRYDIGYFVGQENNDPSVVTASTLFPGNDAQCTVATFPLMDTDTATSNTADTTAWYDQNGNSCGDYHGSQTTKNTVHGVKVLCSNFDSNHNVIIPYTVVWNQTAGSVACTGASNVLPGSPAKCQAGSSTLTNVFSAVNANPTCGKTMTFDGAQNQLTAVITLTNNDPTTGFNNVADGTTFKDDFSQHLPSLTVTNAQCTNSSGGATCPPPDLSFAGNIVTGTISSFPFGSSIEITVTASITPGDTGSFANSVDLTIPPTVAGGANYVFNPQTGFSTWTGACSTEAVPLPVRLQNFDVK